MLGWEEGSRLIRNLTTSNLLHRDWHAIVDHIARRCAAVGFDLVQPLRVDWYNREVEGVYALPDFGRADALAVLIGHSRRMWEPFVHALRTRPHLLDDADPVERYALDSILPALDEVTARWEIRWAHDLAPRRVAMQRVAAVSGLAGLSPSFLSVHPVYGPWIGLRAVVVVDVRGPEERPPSPRLPCTDCERSCLPALRRALASGAPTAGAWREWLAVRDACPVGREHRYREEQIEYHYRKDKEILRHVLVHVRA